MSSRDLMQEHIDDLKDIIYLLNNDRSDLLDELQLKTIKDIQADLGIYCECGNNKSEDEIVCKECI